MQVRGLVAGGSMIILAVASVATLMGRDLVRPAMPAMPATSRGLTTSTAARSASPVAPWNEPRRARLRAAESRATAPHLVVPAHDAALEADLARFGLDALAAALREGSSPAELAKKLPADERLLMSLLTAHPLLARLAAERLAEVGTRVAVPALCDVLASNAPLDVRKSVGTAVAWLASSDDRPLVRSLLDRTNTAEDAGPIVAAALEVLGPDELLRCATETTRDPTVRSAIYSALFDVSDEDAPRTTAALLGALADPSPTVRLGALQALTTLAAGTDAGADAPFDRPAVGSALVSIVRGDPDTPVRQAAAGALLALGDPSTQEGVRLALLQEREPAVRAVLELSMAATPSPAPPSEGQ